MATNPTTDLTEEDAADLQFPKEIVQTCQTTNEMDNIFLSDHPFQTCNVCLSISRLCTCSKCLKCQKILKVPYINCAECKNTNLCCGCFAIGTEIATHKSDHRYRVIKNDFEVFDGAAWTAEEELAMLNILGAYGYGNWSLISAKLRNRTVQEVKQHYDHFYLDYPVDLLPKVPETVQSVFPPVVAPYLFRLVDSDEPPRPAPNSLTFQALGGYNPARSDFELDYDPNAEHVLSILSQYSLDPKHPSYQLLTDLQCGIVRSYTRRLRERKRRKRIIREHGLILLRKTMSWMHRYDRTLTRTFTERMLCFRQFLTGIQFDFIMEGLHQAAELRQRISRLCDYRRKGIRTLQGGEIYEKINQEKEQHKKCLNQFKANPFFNWKSLNNLPVIQATNIPNRRGPFRPLDIMGLPGYERLSIKERDLCSKIRLVPQNYVELKELLIAESNKMGYLKLQTARRMLKIDVNKTRKLYDFLIEEGYIGKPIN